jgi:hypothetical protein
MRNARRMFSPEMQGEVSGALTVPLSCKTYPMLPHEMQGEESGVLRGALSRKICLTILRTNR